MSRAGEIFTVELPKCQYRIGESDAALARNLRARSVTHLVNPKWGRTQTHQILRLRRKMGRFRRVTSCCLSTDALGALDG